MDIENLVFMITGGILGFAGSIGFYYLQRYQKREDFKKGALSECQVLKLRMAVSACKLRHYLGPLEDAVLEWILPILDNYEGPEKNPELVEGLHKIAKLPASKRHALRFANQQADETPQPVTYSMYFLENNFSAMSLCSADYQNRLLRIKNHLDFYNQKTCFVRDQFNQTFESDTDRDTLVKNLNLSYESLADRAKWIVDAIDDLELAS